MMPQGERPARAAVGGCWASGLHRLPRRVAKGGRVQRHHVRELGEQPAGTARAAQPRNDGLPPAGAIERLPGGRGEGGRSERDRGVAMSVRAGVLRAAEGRAADG